MSTCAILVDQQTLVSATMHTHPRLHRNLHDPPAYQFTYMPPSLLCSPHVNFVSGTNGSGKSAVLQGLQCALGASARETGRGTKLEDLVRSGQDEAKVQVSTLSEFFPLGVNPA